MRGTRFLGAVLATALFCAPAWAVEPEEMLKDPDQEARARAITEGLRCVVCQNQSVDASHAPLAHDMRVLVRERIVAGDSDEQVLQFMVARYGNFVLLRPPLQLNTLALWFGPAAFLLFGLATAAIYFYRRRNETPASAAPLSAADEAAVASLIGSDGPAP